MNHPTLASTYTTLDGEVIGLAQLSGHHREVLEEAWRAAEAGMEWAAFANHYVAGPGNPLLEPGYRVTREVATHPLFVALRDMEDRVGIRQGRLRASAGDEAAGSPFKDQEVTVAHAAAAKGVSVRAVYKAIGRGDLVATSGRPALVSVNSLNRWSVSEVRQRARRSGRVRPPLGI